MALCGDLCEGDGTVCDCEIFAAEIVIVVVLSHYTLFYYNLYVNYMYQT